MSNILSLNNSILKYNDGEDYLVKHHIKQLQKVFGFRKEGLDFLLKRYDVNLEDFYKFSFSKSEIPNMRTKTSRLINKDPQAPHYFTALELSSLLAKFFNSVKPNDDPNIAPQYFINNSAKIQVVGASFGNAEVKLFNKNEVKNCQVPIRYEGCIGIINKQAFLNNAIRLFKPRKKVDSNADYKFAICQAKKTKVIYLGVPEPNSRGRYDVIDKSLSTGKNIKTIAEDIELLWSSKMEMAYYPHFWDY